MAVVRHHPIARPGCPQQPLPQPAPATRTVYPAVVDQGLLPSRGERSGLTPIRATESRQRSRLQAQAAGLTTDHKKMGRLRFELGTNRLKANWRFPRSLAVQGLRKRPPNTPPNKSVATGENILPEKRLDRLTTEISKKPPVRPNDLWLPRTATIHGAA